MSLTSEERTKPLILVVDDDRAMRLMIRSEMEQEGYDVVEAGDGLQALSIYECIKPEIVLMDSMMPILDGFSACARLRGFPGGKRTPVLMITGLNDERSVELAFEAGASDLISKPVKWALLCQRVRRLLQARQAEVMLDKSQADTKSIISHSMDGIITVDRHGRIRSFNPAAERIFMYSSTEVFGQGIRMLIPESYGQADCNFMSPKDNWENTTINIQREITGVRNDGSRFPVELTINGFYAGDRLFTVRDITNRKLAEEKIRLATKVFECTSEGIMVTDIEGNIQSVNHAFTIITGYSTEDVIGRNPRLLKSGRHDSCFYNRMLQELHQTGQWQGEIWNLRKNGEVFPEWLLINVIKDEQGKPTHYAAVFSDITEQVRLAEEKQQFIKQTAKSQRLASLGIISAGIAHEINQPLNSIKVIVDGMLFWHKRGRNPEYGKVIDNLQKISSRVGRIDDIIKHMRSYIGMGNVNGLNACNLNDTVNGALGMIAHQLSSHGITVKKTLAEDLPDVSGIANRLEEVVVNLLVNAMQALEKTNSKEKQIILRTRHNGDKVFLEVIDNGTGINDEIADKIFEPFYSTKQAGDGIGLGLSIAYTIVSGCNGEIIAENNELGGATFRVEIPARSNIESANKPSSQANPLGGVSGEHTSC